CRAAPALPDDAYHCPPIVATALEMTADQAGSRRPFWVLIHSVTDRGMTLLHARPLGGSGVSLRIDGDHGEAIHVSLTTGGSQPRGKLYETQAEFEPARLGVRKV
ncbi:MAG: hypothetical protein ACREHD_19685, partial [Pirellulales bacterium]